MRSRVYRLPHLWSAALATPGGPLTAMATARASAPV